MLTVKTAPASEPVTLTEAKDHLRVDQSDSDAQITAMIQAARERTERYLERSLVTQTLVLNLDAFPSVIELPRGPVQSVDLIEYIDRDDNTQTMNASDYVVDKAGGRIVPADGWPKTDDTVNAVTVEYTAGYGAPADVPEAIKHAILLQVERLFDRNPDTDRSLAIVASNLLWPYRQVHV